MFSIYKNFYFLEYQNLIIRSNLIKIIISNEVGYFIIFFDFFNFLVNEKRLHFLINDFILIVSALKHRREKNKRRKRSNN